MAWRIALILFAALAGVAWSNYRWHQGFTAGADTVLCVQSGQIDGWPAAMKTENCQNIKGKKPPFMPGWIRPQGPPANIEIEP